ncbi:MAG: phage terminase large subunit family protein, partial [Thermoguttaceae bacterium]|nr:phage terminase large subunit family protein [Thermoguttaceae bacterium]
LQNDGDGSLSTEFYREHRAAMDEGAVATWPERYNVGEISGVQYAMNLKFRDEDAFLSEYQNQPVDREDGGDMLSAADVANKTSGFARAVAPQESQILTCFIDAHKNLLYWCAVVWERNFTGFVVDYGTYPKQRRSYFQQTDAFPTLSSTHPRAGVEGSLFDGLKALINELLDAGMRREDGLRMNFDKILIDAGWHSDVVYNVCRAMNRGSLILPSHGVFVGASSPPFSTYRRQRGDIVGSHWRVPNAAGQRAFRHAVVDVNYWKTFVHNRLATSFGDPASLSLFGDARDHRLFSEHLTAEYKVSVEANSRRVDEWKLRARRPDNHWFDCLVGCAVGASMCGAELPSLKRQEREPTRTRVTYAEMKRRRG